MSDQSEIDYPSQWLRARAPGQDSIAKATFRVRIDLEPEFGVTTVSCASELRDVKCVAFPGLGLQLVKDGGEALMLDPALFPTDGPLCDLGSAVRFL